WSLISARISVAVSNVNDLYHPEIQTERNRQHRDDRVRVAAPCATASFQYCGITLKVFQIAGRRDRPSACPHPVDNTMPAPQVGKEHDQYTSQCGAGRRVRRCKVYDDMKREEAYDETCGRSFRAAYKLGSHPAGPCRLYVSMCQWTNAATLQQRD